MPGEATALAAGTDVLLPRPFRVVTTRRDTRDTVTLELEPVEGDVLSFDAGQFTMLGVFGAGEVPISISGDPGHPARLVHTIRDVGGVTRALCEAQPGDVLGVRGPYGTDWGVTDGAGGDVVIVAGGIGLAPLRPALLDAAEHRHLFGRVHLLYGARTEEDLLFPDDLETWASEHGIEVAVTVDRAATTWAGRVGLVTELVRDAPYDGPRTLALVCGPELMMRYVAAGLTARGVTDDRIMLSLERNMRCGVGLCGHCQLREYFLCVDGPVLSLAAVRPHLAVREL